MGGAVSCISTKQSRGVWDYLSPEISLPEMQSSANTLKVRRECLGGAAFGGGKLPPPHVRLKFVHSQSTELAVSVGCILT